MKIISHLIRASVAVVLVAIVTACAFPSEVSLPSLVSEETVRPDYRDRLRHRLFWLGPEENWHAACLMGKPIDQLTFDEQRISLPAVDLLYRGHFEERRSAYRSAGYLYRQAADQGLPLAYEKLGMLLIHGRGAPTNRQGGATLIRQAAMLGCAAAQHRYGELLGNGVGVGVNVVDAWMWVALAAEQGYKESSVLLKRLEGVMAQSQKDYAQQNLASLRQHLINFNQGTYGQELVNCTTDRRTEPFVTRRRACHAMGGQHSAEEFDIPRPQVQ